MAQGPSSSPPPPKVPRPLLARLLSPPGPPELLRRRAAGADVVALPGRYSVTYLLLGPQAVAAVDVGSAGDVPRIVAALRWLGRSTADLRWVVPTHLHFDHVMGVDKLAAETGAQVALGRRSWEAAAEGRRLRYPPRLRLWRALPTWPMQGLPFLHREDRSQGLTYGTPWGDNRFSAPLAPPLQHGATLDGLPGWTVLHTPGHSDDSLCLWHAAAGFLVCGDTLRNFCGGEWNQLVTDPVDFAGTQTQLRALDVKAIFPGHGPLMEGPDVLQRVRVLPFWMP